MSLTLGQKLFLVGAILDAIAIVFTLMFKKTILPRIIMLILIAAFTLLMIGGLIVHVLEVREEE